MSCHFLSSKPSAGEDYAGISRNLDFAPGVTMQTVRVYILDDLGQPILEGPETFELVLTMPMNAVLGAPAITVVTINDTISDCKYQCLVYEQRVFFFWGGGQLSIFIHS